VRITLRTAGAALLAVAALSLPAAAQDAPNAPAARPAAPPQDKPAAQRPAAGAQDAGQAQRPAQQPAARPDAAEPPMSKDDMMKKLAAEEGKHRANVAKIDRLRELAQQKGQADRLTALADLLKKENDRYAAVRTRARAAMGDDSFKAMEKRLAQGRGRGPADPAAARERAAQQKPDAGQATRKPDQPQRAPAPKAERDAKPAAPPAERPKANNNRQAKADTGAQKPAADNTRGSNPK